eukprot:scaffold9130_cov85-Skeletonema_marinoi.AAC.1
MKRLVCEPEGQINMLLSGAMLRSSTRWRAQGIIAFISFSSVFSTKTPCPLRFRPLQLDPGQSTARRAPHVPLSSRVQLPSLTLRPSPTMASATTS